MLSCTDSVELNNLCTNIDFIEVTFVAFPVVFLFRIMYLHHLLLLLYHEALVVLNI